MNELTKIKQRILERIEMCLDEVFSSEDEINGFKGPLYSLTEMRKTTVEKIINEEFDRAFLEAPNIEQTIKDTIKEYIDKDCDDVTELLLSLNKDLCERIRKEC